MRDKQGGLHRRAFRVSELSAMLSIPKATVYRFVRMGKIASLRIGKLVLIPAEELEDLLRRHRVSARPSRSKSKKGPAGGDGF